MEAKRKLTGHSLHAEAIRLARSYRLTETELIGILQQIDSSKIFQSLGYTSLFNYCVEALELSESQSSTFVGVARKSMEIPALQEALTSGTLTVSKARRILPVIEESNCAFWIEKAAVLPQKVIEREVAKRNPDLSVAERIRPLSETQAELRCSITYKTEEQLERCRQLLGQKLKRPIRMQEVLGILSEQYLEAHDPVVKAERMATRVAAQHVKRSTRLRSVPNPRAIQAGLRHQINLRDQGQCTQTLPNGTRCPSRQFLHYHHIRPIARGGSTSLDNLTTVCSAHHKMIHLRGGKSG